MQLFPSTRRRFVFCNIQQTCCGNEETWLHREHERGCGAALTSPWRVTKGHCCSHPYSPGLSYSKDPALLSWIPPRSFEITKEGMKGVVRVLCGCHHNSVESGRHACVHKAGQAGTREPADSDLQGVSSLIRLWSMVSVLTYPRRGPPPAPRPPLSRHSELPAAGPGTCWGGARARVCVLTSLPLHQQAYTRCSGLARQRFSA